MAVVTRRYLRQGVVDATLVQRVQSLASVNANFTNVIDINVDNATADFAANLDQFMSSIGFTLDALATAVNVVTHGSRHTSSGGDSAPLATTLVAGIMSAADKTKLDSAASNANPGVIYFGNQGIGALAETRFLTMGAFEIGLADTVELQVAMGRAGTAKNLFIRINSATGNANTIVFTARKNGANTALTVTIAANAVAQISDLVNSFTFAAGDRLSLQLVKALSITNGNCNCSGSMELAA